MHFFPGIYETKRTKKATSFSNPLTGALFSNKDFLKNCKNIPRSISDLDHIKQIKYQGNNQQKGLRETRTLSKKNPITKQERKKMQRQIIAIHATSRMAEPVSKSYRESSILRGKCKKAFDQKTRQQIERTIMNNTFALSKFPQTEGMSQQLSKSLSNTSHSHVSAQFNDIQILILDLLGQKQDFRTKIIRINLQKYFRSFFKKQLSGPCTHQFLDKVQAYIDELLSSQKLDDVVDQQQYPMQIFTISSRMSFMNKLMQFEGKGTGTHEEYIRAMIRFYCIPSKEFRESCLRDILMMLSLQVFQKFNCSRQEEYVLLDETGREVQEILEIKFSTRKLFLTSRKNTIKNFANYHNLLNEFYREGKKLTFTENMKLNFRKRLAQGSFDQSHFNYSQNYDLERLQRCTQLQNVEQILRRRTEIHRVSKFTPREQSFVDSARQQTARNLAVTNNQYKNETFHASLNEVVDKSIVQQSFWKINEKNISPENRNSPSPVRSGNKSPYRTRSSFKRETQYSKEKLQEFLNDTKKKQMNAEVEKSFRDQFRDFVTKNDIIDFQFNHHFKNRILKEVLRKHFLYFLDKTDLQVTKIFQVIESISVPIDNGTVDMDKSTKIQQSLKENASAGNELREEKQKYLQNSLSWEEFRNLKSVVTCSGPKEVIMHFVAKYLDFNEFGELDKQNLSQQIQFILDDKCDIPTIEVITEVIWSWFQSNSIAENGSIRRMTLQSWYQKYKIVYYMLVSLIFGTNHKTVLDLAYEVLC